MEISFGVRRRRRHVPLVPRRDAVPHEGRRAEDHARGGQGAALGEALDHHSRHHHEDLQVGRRREEEDQTSLRAGVYDLRILRGLHREYYISIHKQQILI